MKFFDFWARERAELPADQSAHPIECLGYSNDSVEDAQRVAKQRLRKTVDAIATGKPLDEYEYAEGPLREEAIQKLTDNDQLVAVLSRNSYGTVVLNSANVLFGDIDIEHKRVGATPFGLPLGWLFTKTVKFPTEEEMVQRIEELLHSAPSLGFRLYRTAAGFRYIETSRTYVPNSSEANQIMDALGCDPLYRRLCKTQECFRARVSPKPWRIGVPNPPTKFPYLTEDQRNAIRSWATDYEKSAASYATCEFVGQYGSDDIDPIVGQIVQVHDALTLKDGARRA